MARYKPKFTRTRDRNHGEISQAYERLGLSVYDASPIGVGFPDAVVGGNMPCPSCQAPIRQNLLVEIKDPRASGKKGEIRRDQIEFHTLWRGPIVVVKTIEEALRSAGL